MTEHSYWWTTGAGSGDSPTNYTQSDLSEISKILAASAGFEGVAPGYLNSLAITGASSPVSMDTGGAMVDGRQYKNDAALSITIPTPVTYSRIDRIVLRASWGTTYTVRATRIAGTEASSPTAPAITQTPGSTYDIKLYQVLITTGGAITLTDERTWAALRVDGTTLQVSAGAIGVKAGGIGTAQIANSAITNALLGAGAVLLGNLDPSLKFQKIAEFTGDGIQTSFSFTSIPATFKHLLLLVNAAYYYNVAGYGPLNLRFNNDVGSNYDILCWSHYPPTAEGVSGQNTQAQMAIGGFPFIYGANYYTGSALILVPNYLNTALWKSALAVTASFGADGAEIDQGQWRNTAAINRIDGFFYVSGARPFATGSLVSLYGFN